MKIAILTTKTTHHAFFVKELMNTKNIIDFFLEKEKIFSKYKTTHLIDKKILNYEKKKCFKKKEQFLYKFNKIKEYRDLNNKRFYEFIKSKKYDLVIVFGTRKIKTKLINLFKKNIYNLHGGNPEKYRGLDSFFWSIFNNEFKSLVTTLHVLEEELDTGKIFAKKNIKLKKKMKFQELRYYNTINCVELSKMLIDKYSKGKNIIVGNQKKIGKYYSAMPSDLKDYCIKKFEDYTKKL
jgi:methionyl-tRNA formyltransferase